MRTILIALIIITAFSSCSSKVIPSMEKRCTYDGNGTESQCVKASVRGSEFCRSHKN